MIADPPVFQLFNEIGIINQLSTKIFEGALPKGMTTAQFTVLNHFVRLGIDEKSPAELASAFQITRPTMTSTLTRMARAGLVSIRADPNDGRAKLVSLTDTGREMRESCIAASAVFFPLLGSFISDAEVAEILPTLIRLRVKLDSMRDAKAVTLD